MFFFLIFKHYLQKCVSSNHSYFILTFINVNFFVEVFLGHKIDKHGIHPTDDTMEAILNSPQPKD